MSDRLLADVAAFAAGCVESTDIDPAYPVLRHLQADLGQGEAALWHTIVFVATYRLASAVEVFARHPSPDLWDGDLWRSPTGVERRALRGGAPMQRHIYDLLGRIDGAGGIRAWLTGRFTGDPRADWQAVRATFEEAWGNGRWASYKLAEVLLRVNGWPLCAPDMGMDGATGPRHGLAVLYGATGGSSREDVARMEGQGRDLQGRLTDLGVPLGIEQVETVLCDFHNLLAGRYYVGHDIDVMLGDLGKASVPEWVRGRLLAARAAVTPHPYLGEIHGWPGVDLDRRRIYRETGEVVVR